MNLVQHIAAVPAVDAQSALLGKWKWSECIAQYRLDGQVKICMIASCFTCIRRFAASIHKKKLSNIIRYLYETILMDMRIILTQIDLYHCDPPSALVADISRRKIGGELHRKKATRGRSFHALSRKFQKNCSSANQDAKNTCIQPTTQEILKLTSLSLARWSLRKYGFLENFVDRKCFLWYYLYRW